MKKFLALALVFVLALGLLTGCGEAKQEPEGGDEAVNVCVVVSSTLGDRSFNDSAKEGADKLAADYENITISTIECNNENFDAQMQNAADTAKGKECALALNDKGADVIFQIASKAGDGVFEAAQERGFWAIGVDCDQKYIADDVIICSMKKEVGSSIYDAVKRLLDGDSSLWGTTWVADMSNGYVGIGYGEDGAAQQVPDDVKTAVEELSKKIVSGEITVETTR